ncbi:MAG: sigma-54 dependent transcriptional regulator [Myxococcota bacterium]
MTGGPRHVAIVDDDPSALSLMKGWLEAAGYVTWSFTEGESFLRARPEQASAICLDLGLGDVSGFEVLKALRQLDAQVPTVAMASSGDVGSALTALRSGAYDYLLKPLDNDRLVLSINRAVERWELGRSLDQLRQELARRGRYDQLVGQSPPMEELARQIERVVAEGFPVVLLGEAGTGKDLVGRAIHHSGPRRSGPFVALNLGAVPESLHEVELFGQAQSAERSEPTVGRMQQAEGGTLYLDEIARLSPLTQAGLLRALSSGRVRPVGASDELEVDVRIVCASQRDLLSEVRAGRFREDLYFKLVVHPLHIPPLRSRREDVPSLVRHFMEKYQGDTRRMVGHVDPAAMDAMVAYDWPGNVRELDDVVHRALLAARGDVIEVQHLPPHLSQSMLPTESQDIMGMASDDILPMREVERRAIKRALKATSGSVEKAAKLLGMGRATLYRRLAHYESINQSLT